MIYGVTQTLKKTSKIYTQHERWHMFQTCHTHSYTHSPSSVYLASKVFPPSFSSWPLREQSGGSALFSLTPSPGQRGDKRQKSGLMRFAFLLYRGVRRACTGYD